MPYISETSQYERRATTVIDATPDGDTVAVAIDVKLDQGIDDYVTDLNHHAANGRHYPATSVANDSRFLKQSPAGEVSWADGVVAANAALKDFTNVASGAIAPEKVAQDASNRFVTDAEKGTWVITTQTSATASGTAVDFVGIPAGVKRITVMFDGLTISAASNIIVQLGSSGTPQTTGYDGVIGVIGTGYSATAAHTIGAYLTNGENGVNGTCVVTKTGYHTYPFTYDLSANVSVSTGVIAITTSAGVVLPSALDILRITTLGGSATFTAGIINIAWEF